MLSIERILCPTDFSPCASHAVPHALRMAREHGAELHLFHAIVLYETAPADATYRLPGLEGLYQGLQAQTDAQLRETVPEDPGIITTRAQVRATSPARGILEYAEEREIDLIVMGTHGRRGLRRLLLGSVAEEVVRLASCPVLTVPEKEDSGHEPGVARNIVVPLDFSQHARLALAYAKALAVTSNARVHLLHVIENVIYPDFYPPVWPSGGASSEELREESAAHLREAARDLEEAGIRTETHVRVGRPATEIVEFAAEQGADLVVIASHGLTGLQYMLLGSVAEHVVRGARSPVLTLKTFGRGLEA
jgi:nucleotide-binding universal stress UspA family protein